MIFKINYSVCHVFTPCLANNISQTAHNIKLYCINLGLEFVKSDCEYIYYMYAI